MKIKKVQSFLSSIQIINVCLFVLIVFILSCNTNPKVYHAPTTLQGDSFPYVDSISESDSTWKKDTSYILIKSTQINFYNSYISGQTLSDDCKINDHFYFNIVKDAAGNYRINCHGLIASASAVVPLTSMPSYQTIPTTPSTLFDVRDGKISVTELNQFFNALANAPDHFDFIHHPENYIINIKANSIGIQQDATGRYFGLIITASQTNPPRNESSVKIKINPCPPCTSQ